MIKPKSRKIYHVAELCERVIVLDAGKIAADGPADALLHDRDLMERHGLEAVG